jgi:xanthine dehydrogenase small subunit
MVERHATQCGFCTPGFVMSLYAHQRQGAATDSQTLKDALAGNLCRCTGYGPILAAGQSMGPDPHASEVGALASALKGLRRDEPLALMHGGRSFIAPRTTAQLAEALLARPDATILAGGTDVGLWVTKQHQDLPALISLNDVAELSAIKDLGDAVWIGAGVRYVDAQPALVELHAEFGELMRRIGGLPVRNLGTVCGNIANGSPIGDMPPALIAAGATLVLRHGETKRTIPLETYFLTYGRQDRRPGEFVEAVIVPKIATNRILKIFKLSKRLDQDISAVCAGISATVEGGVVAGARIAFGGMAAIPRRATALERALEGRAWTEAGVAGALDALEQDFQPIDDMRASAGYRLQAAKNLILRAVLESEPGAPRVMGLEPVHD